MSLCFHPHTYFGVCDNVLSINVDSKNKKRENWITKIHCIIHMWFDKPTLTSKTEVRILYPLIEGTGFIMGFKFCMKRCESKNEIKYENNSSERDTNWHTEGPVSVLGWSYC